MEKNLQLQEIIFSSSEAKESQQIGRWQKEGILRKIAPRVYTSNLEEEPEKIIARHIFHIIGKLYPGALLSHRSALEFKPTATGRLFVTYTYTKKIKLQGITLHFLKGTGLLEGDNRLMGELYVSQKARAFLENLQVSKRPGPESKTLTLPQLEDRLEEIIRVHGEDELNKLRDQARDLARPLDMNREFEQLNKIISALLSTQPSRGLKSPLAKARAFGEPYDPHRITLFETLFSALASRAFKSRPDQNNTGQAFKNIAFFESYFSNYIEGTVFELEEAKQHS